jgi:hypothetical protein
MMLHSPCKDCKERILHCHEMCAKYLEYYEANEKAKAERIKAKKERDLLFRQNKQRKQR